MKRRKRKEDELKAILLDLPSCHRQTRSGRTAVCSYTSQQQVPSAGPAGFHPHGQQNSGWKVDWGMGRRRARDRLTWWTCSTHQENTHSGASSGSLSAETFTKPGRK